MLGKEYPNPQCNIGLAEASNIVVSPFETFIGFHFTLIIIALGPIALIYNIVKRKGAAL